jgi:hypothetical protein
MFLSVEWAKRWLPAIFLLTSLFLPWWIVSTVHEPTSRGRLPHDSPIYTFDLSFPWNERADAYFYYSTLDRYMSASIDFSASFHRVPILCFVAGLIFMSGLCGLSGRSKIRTLGGLLGIASIISYFVLVFQASVRWIVFIGPYFSEQISNFPYFGSASGSETHSTWFLSAGFYVALAGSLMLLLPLIRTLVERLRKRLHSS